MARILSIQRRAGLCTVTFNDAPPLRCTRDFALRLRLNTGQSLDDRLLERLRGTASADLAMRLAQRLIQRPRSRREIAHRLREQGVPDPAVYTELERLKAEQEHDEANDALAIARRCVDGRELDWSIIQRRCGDRLRRRGFSPATASRAVQTAWQERRAEHQINRRCADPDSVR